MLNKIPDNKKNEEEYDDDDDVRSGVNQPVSQIKRTSIPSMNASIGANQNGGKELTPKERLLLNKLKKADEEAAKVG